MNRLPFETLLFQSTHSRGVRHGFDTITETEISGFNPRTHEECDFLSDADPKQDYGFNPRTHEECDRGNGNRCPSHQGFNPRTHEECDVAAACARASMACFNPRTHEECDISFAASGLSLRRFQSTHSRGVRLIYPIKLIYC